MRGLVNRERRNTYVVSSRRTMYLLYLLLFVWIETTEANKGKCTDCGGRVGDSGSCVINDL